MAVDIRAESARLPSNQPTSQTSSQSTFGPPTEPPVQAHPPDTPFECLQALAQKHGADEGCVSGRSRDRCGTDHNEESVVVQVLPRVLIGVSESGESARCIVRMHDNEPAMTAGAAEPRGNHGIDKSGTQRRRGSLSAGERVEKVDVSAHGNSDAGHCRHRSDESGVGAAREANDGLCRRQE